MHHDVDAALADLLRLPDEETLDSLWTRDFDRVRAYALRPGKRLRPALVVAGHRFGTATSSGDVRAEVLRFAAATELLHTFLLIHDDVADQSDLRRGGASLHRMLATGRLGEDLAIVAGDHLFARALEAMLETRLPGTAEATRYYLQICRHTAVGQFLDLHLSKASLPEVTLFQTLKVAHLKTARYGFCAPLVCGAILGGASVEIREALDRVGRHLGAAYQLRDDLLGLFGDPKVCGKPSDSDFLQGKITFPVVAAYIRADAHGREQLDALWSLDPAEKDCAALEQARALIHGFGGVTATQRVIDRATRTARRTLNQLPEAGGMRRLLERLADGLAERAS